MNENSSVPIFAPQPQSIGPDLDDLIFAGEGWLVSDR